MLEGIWRMPSNVRSNVINIMCVTAANGKFQRVLVGNSQLRESVNTKTDKKRGPTFFLCDIPSAPTTGSISPKKQSPEPHLHPLDTVESGLKLGETLILETVLIADERYKSLQKHDVSGRLLL